MSVGYKAITWNRFKKRYDLLLAIGIAAFIVVFAATTLALNSAANPVQVLIRSFGVASIVLLHFILAIGPLARLNPKFLPLLYNRRHFGVSLFLIALVHGGLSIFWYHAFGSSNPFVSVFLSDWGSAPGTFPFQAFGFLALMILFVMAATSHDFWLANLTAPVWKTLHMSVYAAYLLLVAHIAFGVLQSETNPLYLILLALGAATITGLHLTAAFHERATDQPVKTTPEEDGFIKVAKVSDIEPDRAIPITLGGERIAVVRYEGKISALSGVCQHQNGPLAEGKFVHGCLTCPWHGYQYHPDTGASPPPFTESVPTFNVRVVDDDIYLHPKPNPAATHKT
jgi:sulfoxide reductase heme-binding subunit YedZ